MKCTGEHGSGQPDEVHGTLDGGAATRYHSADTRAPAPTSREVDDEAMTDWADPRMPPADVCVLRDVLDRRARERPTHVAVVFPDGEEWTYAELRTRVRRVAATLQAAGARQGDHVLIWLPNGAEALLTAWALNYVGAVAVAINTAYRGALLAHVIDNSDARLLVAHAALLPRLTEVPTAGLAHALVVGGLPDASGLPVTDFATAVAGAGEPAEPERPIRPWDLQSIVYTSGTTGPSKGVMSSYFHAWNGMNEVAWPCVRRDDRFLITMPLFHIGGSFIAYAMLCRGGSLVMAEGFSTDGFWPLVRRTRATVVFLLGVMGSFLMKQPPTPDDRVHPLRVAFMVPLTDEAPGLAKRFGVEVWTIFNMTEIATPIISGPEPGRPGFCGRPRAGFEVRLVDEHDLEVPVGAVGELILRSQTPWALNHGYYKNPEATARAWRNGWFHTGDAFRRDEAGNYWFVDRAKDAIRRRGENISSFEVELVVNTHPDVQECAAIPVPSEWGEDEVMVVVAPKLGRRVDPAELLAFLTPRMAHFMLPRYVRVAAELPKTPTAKIQKAELRRDGITEDTWDREAAGIRVRAHRLT
jgi:crotonobetaine/carnitine-CoA ligase